MKSKLIIVKISNSTMTRNRWANNQFMSSSYFWSCMACFLKQVLYILGLMKREEDKYVHEMEEACTKSHGHLRKLIPVIRHQNLSAEKSSEIKKGP